MMDAIIMAGTSKKDVQAFGINKSLIEFKGSSLLSIILTALRQIDSIKRIFIITDVNVKELPEVNCQDVYSVMPAEGVMESIKECIEAYKISGNFIGMASDLPFITVEAIYDFISNCNLDSHLNYSIVSKKVFKKKYPEYKKTFFRLRDGVFTGGNIFMADAAATLKWIEVAKTYFRHRKSPFALVSMIGFRGLVKFILGLLSTHEIEKIFKQKLSSRLTVVKSKYPQIALDIDRPEQFKTLEATSYFT